MKKLMSIGAVCVAALTLAGCNTTSGYYRPVYSEVYVAPSYMPPPPRPYPTVSYVPIVPVRRPVCHIERRRHPHDGRWVQERHCR